MAKFPAKALEMSEEEMGKIALAMAREKMFKGVRFTPQVRREIGEEAKKIGIKFDRVIIFVEILIRENLEKIFESEPTFPKRKRYVNESKLGSAFTTQKD